MVEIRDLQMISPCKLFILKAYVKRKFKVTLDLKDPLSLSLQIQWLENTPRIRRFEEGVKFLLK